MDELSDAITLVRSDLLNCASSLQLTSELLQSQESCIAERAPGAGLHLYGALLLRLGAAAGVQTDAAGGGTTRALELILCAHPVYRVAISQAAVAQAEMLRKPDTDAQRTQLL